MTSLLNGAAVFPLEVFELIIDECDILLRPTTDQDLYHVGRWKDRDSILWSCSLTCRGWRQYAQRLLFHTIFARTDNWSYRRIHKLASVIRERPELGRLVRILVIEINDNPSWIPVTLHGRWLPNLISLQLGLTRSEMRSHAVMPQSFHPYFASYRSVQHLHLLHHVVHSKHGHRTILIPMLTTFSTITYLKLAFYQRADQSSLNHVWKYVGRWSAQKHFLRGLVIVGVFRDEIPRLVLAKANISVEKLELLYSQSIGTCRDLIGKCSDNLRELYLYQGFDDTVHPELSLSRLRGLRRLRLALVSWEPYTLSLLSTLPSPSPLTRIDVYFRFFLDDDALKIRWNELDDILNSSAFPMFSSLNIELRSCSKEDFLQTAEMQGWLRKCFERGIVTYGVEVVDIGDLERRWGFTP